MRPNLIALDMDGVLANFLLAAETYYGKRAEPGQHDFHVQLGMSWPLFMLELENDPDFWLELPTLPQARPVYHAVGEMAKALDAKVVIVTAEGFSRTCAHDKRKWLERMCRQWCLPLVDVICTHHKHLLASHHRILIDDNIDNIDAWENAGGVGVLAPGRCNHLYSFESNAAAIITKGLKNITS